MLPKKCSTFPSEKKLAPNSKAASCKILFLYGYRTLQAVWCFKTSYYKHGEDCLAKASRDRFIVEYVQTVRKIEKSIGGEKLWYMYKEYFGEKHGVGRDAFAKVLSRHGLTLRKPRKGCRTTNSEHAFPLYPNLIKDMAVIRPNQVWVSDITYIRISDGFCYLSPVTDAYSHEIVGCHVGPTLETTHALKALRQACRKLPDPAGKIIHHSDRGVQYASFMYVNELKKMEIQISMTENGDPKENAIAERVNGILKQEFLDHYGKSGAFPPNKSVSISTTHMLKTALKSEYIRSIRAKIG